LFVYKLIVKIIWNTFGEQVQSACIPCTFAELKVRWRTKTVIYSALKIWGRSIKIN